MYLKAYLFLSFLIFLGEIRVQAAAPSCAHVFRFSQQTDGLSQFLLDYQLWGDFQSLYNSKSITEDVFSDYPYFHRQNDQYRYSGGQLAYYEKLGLEPLEEVTLDWYEYPSNYFGGYDPINKYLNQVQKLNAEIPKTNFDL